jgi:hypothetical protein
VFIVVRGTGEQQDTHSDYFAEALGEEWVEVEPGIYEHRPKDPEPAVPPARGDEHPERRAAGF